MEFGDCFIITELPLSVTPDGVEPDDSYTYSSPFPVSAASDCVPSAANAVIPDAMPIAASTDKAVIPPRSLLFLINYPPLINCYADFPVIIVHNSRKSLANM